MTQDVPMRFGLHLLLMVAVPFSVGCGDKPCETNDQCSLPALCLNRVCANPPPVADHEPCQHDAHCQGGACVFTADGGTCATTCASATDCASSKCAPTPDLRTDGARLRLTCGPEGGERYFAERCSTDTECRSGLCNDSHCTSPCGVCPADFTCTPTTLTRQGLPLDVGACGWWPVDHVIELGAVDTSATGTQPLSFTLPDGYGAFTVVLEDAEGQVPSVLTGPDGTVFIELLGPSTVVPPTWRAPRPEPEPRRCWYR